LRLPNTNQDYVDKYVEIKGRECIDQAMALGKGLIILSFHMGSWEIANMATKNLGYPYKVIVSEQSRYPKLDRILNTYRRMGKDIVIFKKISTKQIIKSLDVNEIVTLTIDQGGKEGNLIKFFNKTASMQTGWIRLALRYKVPVVVGYILRKEGPYQKLVFNKFEVEKNGNPENDKKINLEKITLSLEEIISQNAQQYLWFFKVWKYSNERFVTILNDGKVGHLRQSQSVCKTLREEALKRNLSLNVTTVDIKFKNKLFQAMVTLYSLVTSKRLYRGCISSLRMFLREESYKQLLAARADYVISCGSSTAPVNNILSKASFARSFVILKPSILSTNKFDLAIFPEHDNPPKRENIVITQGSLNLIDSEYLKEQAESLVKRYPEFEANKKDKIGILLGGDGKDYVMSKEVISNLLAEVKNISETFGLEVLITTSRRTSGDIDELIKRELGSFSRCKLMVVANEKNIPEAIGGILNFSKFIAVSSDSISMISEAASAGKHVIVFNASGNGKAEKNKRHNMFLNSLRKKKYIHWLDKNNSFSKIIETIYSEQPNIKVLKDSEKIRKAVSKML